MREIIFQILVYRRSKVRQLCRGSKAISGRGAARMGRDGREGEDMVWEHEREGKAERIGERRKRNSLREDFPKEAQCFLR